MEKRKLKLAATSFIFRFVAADFSLRFLQVIIQIPYQSCFGIRKCVCQPLPGRGRRGRGGVLVREGHLGGAAQPVVVTVPF